MVDTRHKDYKPGECSKTTVQKASQTGKGRFIFERWSSLAPLAALEFKNKNKQIQGFVILREGCGIHYML